MYFIFLEVIWDVVLNEGDEIIFKEIVYKVIKEFNLERKGWRKMEVNMWYVS